VHQFVFHSFRLKVAIPALLLAALSLSPVSVAQDEERRPPPASEQTFTALARRLSADLQKQCVTRIVVMDFEDPNGKVTPFGAWLAEQLSSAPGNPWAPIEIEDRGAAAGLMTLSDDPGTLEAGQSRAEKIIVIGEALRAAIVTGSYGPAENGIGISVSAATSCESEETVWKIAMTDDMKSRLGAPPESLEPSDGVFETGRGGITVPRCEYCPNPQFTKEAEEHNLEGTVRLLVVVGAEGRATAMSVTMKLGGGLDEAAVESVRKWRFKPAVNVDGKPVPARVPVEVVFRMH
jgi:TonB family protein